MQGTPAVLYAGHVQISVRTVLHGMVLSKLLFWSKSFFVFYIFYWPASTTYWYCASPPPPRFPNRYRTVGPQLLALSSSNTTLIPPNLSGQDSAPCRCPPALRLASRKQASTPEAAPRGRPDNRSKLKTEWPVFASPVSSIRHEFVVAESST